VAVGLGTVHLLSDGTEKRWSILGIALGVWSQFASFPERRAFKIRARFLSPSSELDRSSRSNAHEQSSFIAHASTEAQ
jgi:hypothetical protein